MFAYYHEKENNNITPESLNKNISLNFYSGNFWWTTVKSINRIPKYVKKVWGVLENRYFGETYFINRIPGWNPAVLYPPLNDYKNFYKIFLKNFFYNSYKYIFISNY